MYANAFLFVLLECLQCYLAGSWCGCSREFGIILFLLLVLLSAALIWVFFGARKDDILYRCFLKAASVEVFCKAVSGKSPAEFCKLKTSRHFKHFKI